MSVKIRKPVPSDIDIAQSAGLQPIVRVAEALGLGEGKTTTTVGLCQALGAHLGKKVVNPRFGNGGRGY